MNILFEHSVMCKAKKKAIICAKNAEEEIKHYMVEFISRSTFRNVIWQFINLLKKDC